MSIPTNLVILTPPSLPQGYCPPNWQSLANDLIGGTQVNFLIQQGQFIYNYGSATPAPENRIYPWLYTPTGQWFTFQFALWVAPVSPSLLVADFRQIWIPTIGTPENVAWSLDSGDGTDPSVAGNVTDITGAMWEVDHQVDGQFLLAAGAVPNSNPAITAQISTQGGEAQHTLDLTEIPSHSHIYAKGNGSTSPIGGAAEPWPPPNVGADIATNPAGGDPTNNNATKPHNNMPPYFAIWLLKHTARKFYTLPA